MWRESLYTVCAGALRFCSQPPCVHQLDTQVSWAPSSPHEGVTRIVSAVGTDARRGGTMMRKALLTH